MRWWLQTNTTLFSVDNSAVRGLDYSTLDPSIWMVQWTEGRGEIERFSAEGTNLNGLREAFIDVTPYVPFFQQFMTLLPGLLLDQAKKIQIELIGEVFDSKRQTPFHYPVAAGDYWWDATDATLFSSLVPALQNATSSINSIVARLNSVVPALNNNDASIISQTNANAAAYIVAPGNQFINETNAWVVTPTNNSLNTIATMFGNGDANVDQFNALVNYINDTVLSNYGSGTNLSVSVNYGLYTAGGPYAAGFSGQIPHSGNAMAYVGSNPYRLTGIDQNFSWPAIALTAVPWTALPNVANSNVVWIPIGATAPVNVTPTEQAAILSGIATRTNQLNLVKNTKIGEVNALTTIPAVIAYDVLADWPVIPLPPGWNPAMMPIGGSSRSVAIVGTPAAPSGGGGIPEAPSDDVTYGRRNAVWNPALALSGDVLDGGNY